MTFDRCEVRGCEGTAVVIYSDGGTWCLPCDAHYNEDSGCDCCADVGRFGPRAGHR